MSGIVKMANEWHGGKGSKTRKAEDQDAFAQNWDAIFGKKDKQCTEAVASCEEVCDTTPVIETTTQSENQNDK
jgi:hypothetical protein